MMPDTVRRQFDRIQMRDAENVRQALQQMHEAERDIAARLERQAKRRGVKALAAIFHVHRDTIRHWRAKPDTFRACLLPVLLLLDSTDSRP